MLQKLHHIAYRCHDAQQTVDFYTKVIGLKYAAALMPPEGQITYGEPVDDIHIFFELADGSYLAFFDVASSPPEAKDENTPWWVKHLAFEVADMEALLEGKRRLEAAGHEVLGPKDHGLCMSIYFFDPNGHRLEMAVRTDSAKMRDDMATKAPEALKEWNSLKQRKYGARTAAA